MTRADTAVPARLSGLQVGLVEDSWPLAFGERDLDANNILSRKTRWRLRREGKFPLPRSVGGRQIYVAAEIREWLNDPAAWAAEHGAA